MTTHINHVSGAKAAYFIQPIHEKEGALEVSLLSSPHHGDMKLYLTPKQLT